MRTYIAIDLKSFYASVECVERGLDPLDTNLVVADVSRTEKTICLAVSPSLKAWGIPGRARLFEVAQKVREVNARRLSEAPVQTFQGKSIYQSELKDHPERELSYMAATPRMALYMRYSSKIYQIYLQYVAPEDIHVYSIDEVFMDVTKYLKTYGMSAHELARTMIRQVLRETGITATAGIGPNLYLCKIAMDIGAKHAIPDQDGVRIAQLDERSYRQQMWSHRPLTDFWRLGRCTARKLEQVGIFTMGDIARCSLENEELLYHLFGINAELLIDHAWGQEPCTMDMIRKYQPKDNSFSSGQVLTEPYPFEKARIVAGEMADAAALDLLDKRMVTDQLVLHVGYDEKSLAPDKDGAVYEGEVKADWYGKTVPKPAHATVNLKSYTSSPRVIREALLAQFDASVNPALLVRRLFVTVNHVIPEEKLQEKAHAYEQLDMFAEEEAPAETEALLKERRAREAMLKIKKKFGKNAILMGLNMEEGATGRDRNAQIGGHKA